MSTLPPSPAEEPPRRSGWRGWSTRRKGIGVAVAVLVGLLVLGSLTGRDPTPTASPTVPPIAAPTVIPTAGEGTPTGGTVYTINLEATAAGPTSVNVTGTTNLPDKSRIVLSASRAHQLRGEDDVRAVSAGRETVTVSGGQFAGTLVLDESDLLVLVGTGPGEDYVEAIDQDLTVCAQFQTGTDLQGQQRQPPAVVEVVGPYGEALANSSQVTVFGSATATPSNWLRVMLDVLLPSHALDQIASQQGAPPQEQELEGFCL